MILNENVLIKTMIKGKLIYSIDGLFFPLKSHLISVHIIILIRKVRVAKVNFITLVSIEYRHTFAAKLCGVLVIIKIIKHIMNTKNIARGQAVSISTDCVSVIRIIEYLPPYISFSYHLYQIRREILKL